MRSPQGDRRALVASLLLRGVDVVVLLGVLRHRQGDWTVRMISREMRIPLASVQRSLGRLALTPAFDPQGRRADIAGCEALFEHALRFVCPTSTGERARGVPTAWALPRLSRRLRPAADAPQPVWPQRGGPVQGVAVRPLHAAVPKLAAEDEEMHELLALTDAARLGDDRVSQRAIAMLKDWVAASPGATGG